MTAAFCTQDPAAGRPFSVSAKNLSLIGIGVGVSIRVGICVCICVGIRVSLCSVEDVLLFGFLRGLGHLLFIFFCFIVLRINLGLVNLNRVLFWHYIIRGRFSL